MASSNQHPLHHPHLSTDLPPYSQAFPQHRTANSTPVSSPGLFSPSFHQRPNTALPISSSDTTSPAAFPSSPYLHPLQMQNRQVRETNKALIDLDTESGRKLINHYEVIEEIGRGVHGKVKLARNLENNSFVAIKIIPRFSKKRRLGKVTASPEDKTKKEIAILKKIRHPNVVGLLEIIDDPELKKIYMVLEHVELGEIVWRRKGLPTICAIERRRVEKEVRGETTTEEEEQYFLMLERRQALKDLKRAKMQQSQQGPVDYWSIENGAAIDEGSELARSLGRDSDHFEFGDDYFERAYSFTGSRATSRAPSRTPSRAPSRRESLHSATRTNTPLPMEHDSTSIDISDIDENETPGAEAPVHSQPGSSSALNTAIHDYGPPDPVRRERTPSVADSIISHMSSVDYNAQSLDPFADDYSYVPCFTIEDARATFRDTVLGLEYLHYEGVVHRDIKPANLLWTKDHRVKISDFGVSYFGRPIREGEPDEMVSESEAHDFDNDLELAKTVGTPAFFAPELCYTDIEQFQPKVSEQIDVWSLGVTLYCLIFARIPFMAEDEFQMFQKIAKEDVHIPKRRLKPVDPRISGESIPGGPAADSIHRRDDALEYEDIDDTLEDLLRKMLQKNPDRRIRLRDVKRHPFVAEGIPDLLAWLDDTDPSRLTAGRKIQVDEREVKHAVVPLTLLERARSVVKKTLGRVMHTHTRSDRTEGSRRRAPSSGNSSAGEGSSNPSSAGPGRDGRRRSIRPDDYFPYPYREGEHPLSQSVTASPQTSSIYEDDRNISRQDLSLTEGNMRRVGSGASGDSRFFGDRSSRPISSTSLSSRGSRHGRKKSLTNTFLSLTPGIKESQTTPVTPVLENDPDDDPSTMLRKARDYRPREEPSRSHSVDRSLFGSDDKRAEAKVSVSEALAPGTMDMGSSTRRPLSLKSSVSALTDHSSPPSPQIFSPLAVRGYQHGLPNSDPSMFEKCPAPVQLDQRPNTSHRILNLEIPVRAYKSSTPESFSRAQAQLLRRQQREEEEHSKRSQLAASCARTNPQSVHCPDSSARELTETKESPPSRGDTLETTATSDSASPANFNTPLTSPSVVTSPVNLSNPDDGIGSTQPHCSDHSLPALLSGASSISDPEGDFLVQPGSVNRRSLIDTTDSLTPPALLKEPANGFPLEALNSHTYLVTNPHHGMSSSFSPPHRVEEEDSDSDEGLVMAKSRKKKALATEQETGAYARVLPPEPKRRDTQTSIRSTETARRVYGE